MASGYMVGTLGGYLGPVPGAGTQGAPTITVDDAATMSALDITLFSNSTITRVETYKDFFFLDKVTVRTAVPDEVVASSSPTAWWVRMFISDPYWQVQATWIIDPINGDDENEGDILADALRTRGEYARRTDGTNLRNDVTVTIQSSLAADDTRIPHRPQASLSLGIATGWLIRYVGVKTSLFTGTITALTNRNGATAQPTLLTVASLPVSWTASGLVGKIIEQSDGVGGVIRGIVVKDMGAKQAWISPPLTNSYSQGATFTNGQDITVYDVPTLSDTIVQAIEYHYAEFSYLQAAQWEWFGHYNDFTSCLGTQLTSYGGTDNLRGCGIQTLVKVDGTAQITGGYGHYASGGGCNIRFVGHTTVRQQVGGGALTNLGGIIGTSGPSAGSPSDLEFPDATSPIHFSNVNNGQTTLDGYCYGTLASGTIVVNFATGSRDSRVSFAQLPSFGGATGINFADAGWTGSTANLSTAEVSDVFNNRVIGPAGPAYAMLQTVYLQAQGILSQTYDRFGSGASSLMVGGTVYYLGLPLLAGQLVSNLTYAVGVIATLPTLSKIGLYDAAGNRLAASADLGTAWTTTGQKTSAFAASFRVLTTALYYAAIISVATTPPNVVRGSTGAGAPNWIAAIGAGQLLYGTQTGQTDLPNPGVIAAANTSFGFWMAAS